MNKDTHLQSFTYDRVKMKMLVDFENPISVKYAHRAIDTWKPLFDLVEIEFHQCVTPTHPSFSSTRFCTHKVINNVPDNHHVLRCNFRSFTEIAILETYYQLWQKIVDGEDFIMMEHDAFLRSGHEDTVRKLIENRHEYKYQVMGSAMECWWINRQVAKNLIALADRDFCHQLRGPMWYLEMAGISEPIRDAYYEIDPNKGFEHDIYRFAEQMQNWLDKGIIGICPHNLKAFWPIGRSSRKNPVPLSYTGHDPLVYGNRFGTKRPKATFREGYKHLPEEYRDVDVVSRPVVQAIDLDHGITNMRYDRDPETNEERVKPVDIYHTEKGSGGVQVDLDYDF